MRYVNLHKKSNEKPATTAARIRPFNFRLVVLVTAVFAIAYFGFYLHNLFSKLQFNAKDILKAPVAAVTYVANKDPQVKNDNGRVNVALLGIGGKGHDGAYLTDTIMVASIDIKTGNAAMISLPRDTWVQKTRSKLNAVYAFGWEKGDGMGLKQIEETLQDFLGIPIHYGFRIDFSGFEKAIDLVGGVDVTVDVPFKDYQYPVRGKEDDMCGYREVTEKVASESGELTIKKIVDASGNAIPENVNPYACRYETLTFKQGPVTLDGETALKFVRSRHGTNNEGSDFARSRRQQKVIAGFREKIFSSGFLLDGAKVGSMIATFGDSVDTNIDPSEYGEFLKLAQRYKDGTTKAHTVTAEGQDALLVVPPSNAPYGGQYVLVPRAGAQDWTEIQASVKKWLEEVNVPEQTATASATPKL